RLMTSTGYPVRSLTTSSSTCCSSARAGRDAVATGAVAGADVAATTGESTDAGAGGRASNTGGGTTGPGGGIEIPACPFARLRDCAGVTDGTGVTAGGATVCA